LASKTLRISDVKGKIKTKRWGKSVNLLVQKALMHVTQGQNYWVWTIKEKLLFTKQLPRIKKWCFTLTNEDDE
jgi:hypothetical protein